MNIQQGIATGNRNQPVHWERTINIQAVATGTTKGEELKSGEGEAFKTKATAAESVPRGIWCEKASRQRGGQQEPPQPQRCAERCGGRAGINSRGCNIPGCCHVPGL